MSSLLWLRWVLVGLGALLGLVLLAYGNVLVGVLLLAITAVRVAVLITVQRRRSEWMQRGRLRGAERPRQPPR
jgi:hypothetical protein